MRRLVRTCSWGSRGSPRPPRRAVSAYRAALAVAPSSDSDLPHVHAKGYDGHPIRCLATRIACRSKAGVRSSTTMSAPPGGSSIARSRSPPRIRSSSTGAGASRVAEQRPDEALLSFGRVIAARPGAPPVFLARAYLDRGLLLEARHDETGAIDAWRSAAHVFGADAATRAKADAAIARVTTARSIDRTATLTPVVTNNTRRHFFSSVMRRSRLTTVVRKWLRNARCFDNTQSLCLTVIFSHP